MPVEVRPLGVRCNLKCRYCYQNQQRQAGNLTNTYDMNKIKAAVSKAGGPVSMFGGEPLLMSDYDLEYLLDWGYRKYGRNSIQSNGTLINENHIRMFKKYNVSVGISIDGPDELNDLRWAGTLKKTREATTLTMSAIERLSRENIHPSIIITLHRANGTSDKLPKMHEWVRYLDRIGILGVRLHILEVDDEQIRKKYVLSTSENIEALNSFANLEQELSKLKFDVFTDMKNLLLGKDNSATCVWTACDPYNTQAVRGVEGMGQTSNCGRTNKDGIDYPKADSFAFYRYLSLYNTPREYGGCKGCRFFLMCKGQCPGTAIAGDWRNRSEYCEVWERLFSQLEQELVKAGKEPISMQSSLRKQVETILVHGWKQGKNLMIAQILSRMDEAHSSQTVDLRPSGGHVDIPHNDHLDSRS